MASLSERVAPADTGACNPTTSREARTLLVDNYDSFTYNLFHLIARVTGAPPRVIRNDEPGFSLDDVREFDNVIISPGPGRPERTEDFGICTDIIHSGMLPVLGVCLGHQGICHVAGASVRRAPEPYHGRISSIHHNDADLFRGIPSPLAVVRYHSLIVTDLPPTIEPIAWTTEGLVMAVRHRSWPQWGVQFHPESIVSQYGAELLSNFLQLSRAHRPIGADDRRSRSRSVPAHAPSLASVPSPAPKAPTHRLIYRQLRRSASSERVFQELYSERQHAFWLDSSLPGSERGRFSFIGDASGPLSRLAVADVWTNQVRVTAGGTTEVFSAGFLDWLSADLARHVIEAPCLPFGFTLGWVGYLGYELKAQCGGDRVHRSQDPDAAMIFADRMIAFDHATDEVYVLALAEAAGDLRADRWVEETCDRLSALAGADSNPALAPLPDPLAGPLTLRHPSDRYLELIATCQQNIAAGESYELCLTNMVTGAGRVEPWPAYRFLRQTSPAPFAAFLRLGDLAVLSSSPERFLSVSHDGWLESRPIKGTRPRGAGTTEDAALADDLRNSEKDRAENLMIVDLVRNDLGRCGEEGSVVVDRLFQVETYNTVHQMVSTIRARRRPDQSTVDCVRVAFPGGSMTGAPKKRTMQLLDQIEAGPRGIYSGALGYLSLSGAADLSIVIRTLVVHRDDVSFGVGGAIVALSDPASELEETAIKARGLLRVLQVPFPR